MAPIIIYFIILVIGLCSEIQRHGQPKSGHYDATHVVIGITIQILLMYWGGFFDPLFIK